MQTNFTEVQLADPEIAVANDILRSCVHCGMCTATCPTFVTLGDELNSPRGRIYLIKDMLEKSRPAGEEEVLHIDRCLSCLSCMTTCPSGVNYMHLVDHARVHIETTYKRPVHDRLLRDALARILPYPNRMRTALHLARLGKPFSFIFAGESMFAKRLRAMLNLAPAQMAASAVARRHAAQSHRPNQRPCRVACRLRATGDCALDQLRHHRAAQPSGDRRRHPRQCRLLRRAGAPYGPA